MLPNKHQGGVVLIIVLVFLAITSLAASTLAVSQATQAQRLREEELLFVGDQYRRALRSYKASAVGGVSGVYPTALSQLLEDDRFVPPVHHLRRLYPDPFTGAADWDLVLVEGRIVGVRSRSQLKPIRQLGLTGDNAGLLGNACYCEWEFSAASGPLKDQAR